METARLDRYQKSYKRFNDLHSEAQDDSASSTEDESLNEMLRLQGLIDKSHKKLDKIDG